MAISLIMDLTLEQGAGRESQVQPPMSVWAHYFEIDLDEPPELTLIDRKGSNAQVEHRPVVRHDHNWTIEVADAGLPRPALLRMVRTGKNAYDYWVYRPGDEEYDHCRWLLDHLPNPYWTHGRLWLVL